MNTEILDLQILWEKFGKVPQSDIGLGLFPILKLFFSFHLSCLYPKAIAR